MAAYALGIDLGTTNSCSCVFEEGQLITIPNEINQKVTPSFVKIEENRNVLVGKAAKDWWVETPDRVIYDVKRLIGRRFEESTVQNDLKFWSFNVQESHGSPVIVLDEDTYLPEQISAKVLADLRDNARSYLRNDDIAQAVITVPAYFNDGQRQATKHAGELAGLKVLRIVNEPTAAAIAYMFRYPLATEKKNLVVFDLGGGTFDISVLSMEKGNIEVLAVGGDSHLGGNDFDVELVNYCIDEFCGKNHLNFSAYENSDDIGRRSKASRLKRRLRFRCEEAKGNLSGHRCERVLVAIDGALDGLDLSVQITRETFNGITAKYFAKCIDILRKVLEVPNMDPKKDVDEVLLVGGSTLIPKLKELLTEFFGKRPCTLLDPSEAVAEGAAILAALMINKGELKTRDGRIFTLNFQDVISMSLGIECLGGETRELKFTKIIPSNTPIPCSSWQDFYPRSRKTQINIYEGEEEDPGKNHKLGTFTTQAFPANQRILYVHFAVNEEGILDVMVTYRATEAKDKYRLELSTNNGRLSQEQLLKLKVKDNSGTTITPYRPRWK